MKSLVWKLRYFLLITYTFILLCLLVVILSDKIELHLLLNDFHTPFWDVFFKNITWMGDGAFALLLLPYLVLFVEFRTFLISLFTCLIAGILAQFFKKIIFTEALRPGMLIPHEKLYIVDGVHLHSMHSFPSGHTTSAFAVCILITFFNRKNKYAQISLALAAICIGYSRVYLSQHFLEDIVFGGFLGIISFFIAFQIMQYFHFNQLNKPLFDWIFAKQERMLESKNRLVASFNLLSE